MWASAGSASRSSPRPWTRSGSVRRKPDSSVLSVRARLLRRAVRPQRLDQLVAGDGAVAIEREIAEQDPAEPARKLALAAAAVDLQPDLATELDGYHDATIPGHSGFVEIGCGGCALLPSSPERKSMRKVGLLLAVAALVARRHRVGEHDQRRFDRDLHGRLRRSQPRPRLGRARTTRPAAPSGAMPVGVGQRRADHERLRRVRDRLAATRSPATPPTCPLPDAVVADLGDRDDSYWDWDGPSTIDGGHGNDNPIFGKGGDDVIRGGIGSDLLFGQEGDDTLDGGPGDDYLEGVPCWCEDEAITHGARHVHRRRRQRQRHLRGPQREPRAQPRRRRQRRRAGRGRQHRRRTSLSDRRRATAPTSSPATPRATRSAGGEGDDVLAGARRRRQPRRRHRQRPADGRRRPGHARRRRRRRRAGRRRGRRPLLGRPDRRLHHLLVRERAGRDRRARRRAASRSTAGPGRTR